MPAISEILEDFSAPTRNASLWNLAVGSGSALQSDGRLTISPASNQTPATYDGYSSVNTYDLTGSSIRVEYVQGLATSNGCEAALTLEAGSSSNVMSIVSIYNGYVLRLRTGGTYDDTYLNPRNDPLYRWWRLREQGGTLYWDTSADGITWTNRRSAASTFALTSLRVKLSAGTWQNIATPGQAIFDNVNISNTPTSAWLAL